VITDVSYDHQKYLGDTLPQIAYEKSKIIKRERPVVIGVKNSESLNVIIEEAKIAMRLTTFWEKILASRM